MKPAPRLTVTSVRHAAREGSCVSCSGRPTRNAGDSCMQSSLACRPGEAGTAARPCGDTTLGACSTPGRCEARAAAVRRSKWGRTLRCVCVGLLQRLHAAVGAPRRCQLRVLCRYQPRGRDRSARGGWGAATRLPGRHSPVAKQLRVRLAAAPAASAPRRATHRLARSCSLLGVGPATPQGASDERRLATASGTFSLLATSALAPVAASPTSAVSMGKRARTHSRRHTGHTKRFRRAHKQLRASTDVTSLSASSRGNDDEHGAVPASECGAPACRSASMRPSPRAGSEPGVSSSVCVLPGCRRG